MQITNFKNLSKNSLRKKALEIAEAGYEAIEIEKVIHKKIELKNNYLIINTITRDSMTVHRLKIDLSKYKRIFLVGAGKGSALASAMLAKILGDKLTGGIALDVQYQEVEPPKINGNIRRSNLQKLEILTGSHPLPSKKNITATQKIVKLAQSLKEDDLLIAFICGGGSALLCGSEKELKYSQTVFKELTSAGANILELNTVRKHLSEVKGGNLAKLAYPATIVSLIVSDVPTANNNLSVVASGPTVFDKTTKKDAERILKKYLQRKSACLSALIRDLKETPKKKKYFAKAKNILFLSNREPILAMAKKAKELGFKQKIYSHSLQGEAKDVLLSLFKTLPYREAPKIILAGGETTVTMNQELGIRNYGKGGRNMESVLGALSLIPNSYFILHNSVILSIASDGRDNTEVAGAIGDILTIKKEKKLKLDPQEFLENHNSFNFFKKTGDLIYANQKTFNVADLMLVLSAPKE